MYIFDIFMFFLVRVTQVIILLVLTLTLTKYLTEFSTMTKLLFFAYLADL
jgi:hypothetical protein